MPAFPTESELFPTGDLAPATAKAKFLQWLQASTGLLGSTGNAADARAALGFKRGADIASAATINLTTATGDLVDVTGTTTITAITLADGEERTVRFTGALTLTNGASLVLPGGANIATAAGDFASFRGYASGVVRCERYTRASGAALLLASSAEAQALTNTVKTITPATLAAAFQGGNQSLAANGYQKLPGGLILQWGSITIVAGGSTITLPVAFNNTNYRLCALPYSASGTGFGGNLTEINQSSRTATQFQLRGFDSTGVGAAVTAQWFAIGY